MRRSEADRLASSRHRRRFSDFDFARLSRVLAAAAGPLGQRKAGAATGEESAPMIQPLRKTHRLIFFVLGVALPLLFIAGLVSRHAPLSAVGPVEDKLAQRNRGTKFVMNHSS